MIARFTEGGHGAPAWARRRSESNISSGPSSGACRIRWRWVGTRKAVVGRSRRSTSSAVEASKRLRMAKRPAREQRAGTEAHRDRVVHRRADQVQVRGIEVPDCRLVLEDRLCGALVPHPGGHALGSSGSARRVVHRAGQRVRRQLRRRALEQARQHGVVEDLEGRLRIGDEKVALGRGERGVEEDRDHPAACRAEDGTDQIGRRREAEGDAIAHRAASGAQRPRHPALTVLGVRRLEHLHRRRALRHPGSVPTVAPASRETMAL